MKSDGSDSKSKYFCGGVLIDESTVVTGEFFSFNYSNFCYDTLNAISNCRTIGDPLEEQEKLNFLSSL